MLFDSGHVIRSPRPFGGRRPELCLYQSNVLSEAGSVPVQEVREGGSGEGVEKWEGEEMEG